MRPSTSLSPFRDRRLGRPATIIAGAAVGIVATRAKSALEPPLQRLGERLFPSTDDELERRGADVTGHPDRMPPPNLVRDVGARIGDGDVSDSTVDRWEQILHFGTGTAFGIAYLSAARSFPRVTTGYGLPAGAAFFAATHGSSVPLLGIQARPDRMPTAWWVWELGSHLAFAAIVESGRRAVVAAFGRLS